MMYDPVLVRPMREELINLGVQELLTPEDVNAHLSNLKGTALVIVNSVCGCAAANARPAIALIASYPKKPTYLFTVFAGMETEAVAQARSYFVGYPPSSPSIGLLKDRKLVFMLERHQIEGRSAEEIASDLKNAFEIYCS